MKGIPRVGFLLDTKLRGDKTCPMSQVGQPLAEKIYAALLIPAWMWTLGWLAYAHFEKTAGGPLTEFYSSLGLIILAFGPIAGLFCLCKVAAMVRHDGAPPISRPLEDRMYSALILPARIWTLGWILFAVPLGVWLPPTVGVTLFGPYAVLLIAPIPLLFALHWIATRMRDSHEPPADQKPIGKDLYSELMVCAIVWTATWAVFGIPDAIFVKIRMYDPIYLDPVGLLAILAPAPMLFLLKRAYVMIRDLPR